MVQVCLLTLSGVSNSCRTHCGACSSAEEDQQIPSTPRPEWRAVQDFACCVSAHPKIWIRLSCSKPLMSSPSWEKKKKRHGNSCWHFVFTSAGLNALLMRVDKSASPGRKREYANPYCRAVNDAKGDFIWQQRSLSARWWTAMKIIYALKCTSLLEKSKSIVSCLQLGVPSH